MSHAQNASVLRGRPLPNLLVLSVSGGAARELADVCDRELSDFARGSIG